MKSENQCNTKNLVRKKYLSMRNSMKKCDVQALSDIVFENFRDLNLSYKSVMTYLNFGNEVSTRNFINFFKSCDKEISIPMCSQTSMCAVKLVDFMQFKINKFGILEPENPVIIDESSIDICIVPGVVFDKLGNRIGFGKGYYDRFFQNKDMIKIGICYDFQISDEEIESESHDVKMDYVISDKRILKL